MSENEIMGSAFNDLEDTKAEFDGKTFGQLNDRESQPLFAQCWEMIDKISNYGTDDNIGNTQQTILNIAEDCKIKIPSRIISLHQILDFLFFGEHATKTVFEKIYAAIKSIYVEVMNQLTISINMQIVKSMEYAGFEKREAKEYIESFLMGI